MCGGVEVCRSGRGPVASAKVADADRTMPDLRSDRTNTLSSINAAILCLGRSLSVDERKECVYVAVCANGGKQQTDVQRESSAVPYLPSPVVSESNAASGWTHTHSE